MGVVGVTDLSGGYLKLRQDTFLTHDQRLQRLQNPVIQPLDPGKDSFPLSPSKIAKDVFSGVIETPRQVVGGVTDAAREVGEAAASVFDALSIPSVVQITNEKGEIDFDLITRKELKERGGKFVAEKMKVAEPRSTTAGLIRGVAQFLTGFIPAMRAAKGIGPATKAATAVRSAAVGLAVDMTVFDPLEDRFSNLIDKFPVLRNPVTEFLKAKPEDTEALGRFKNAVEGLGLGILSDGFTHATRGIKANRIRKIGEKAAAAEAEVIEKVAKIPVGEPEKEFIQFDKTKVEEPTFKIGQEKAGQERALNINLDRINTTKDIKDLIADVGKTFSKDINKARREVISNKQTKNLADDLGMTVDDLLARRRGEAFNAEQALAARQILVASGENLIALAKKAQVGSELDIIKFRKAMSQHHAIQAQVSGLTAEAGRALQAFKIKAKSIKGQQRLINEALEIGGGVENSKALAKQFAELETGLQVNQFVKQASKATTRRMMFEAWINGLLSSPATHAVNVLSNAMVVGWSVGERKVASMIGKSLDVQSIQEGEVIAQLFGMVQGTKDGMKLAWQALKTGEPTDAMSKLEVQSRKAITGENLNLAGPAGRFADFVGSAVRTPGRFLTAGDELFKSIGYRMELHAQAFRQASQEGLEGTALAARIDDIIKNPPENIEFAAIDASRYQTFTKPLEESGQAISQAINKTPAARIIVPFLRTPVNIMKFVGERTILAPLSANVRKEIAAGGARRDLALAKIATGSIIMAAAADYTVSGQITGAGPTNPAMRNLLRATGWQPYSIKVGDTWYSYNRLDPVGATIGIAADIAEIIGQSGDIDALDLTAAATISVAQNITSKTYLSGLAEFFDVMSNVSPDPEKNNTRAKRWIERLAGSAVPAGVAQVERTLSPELSATNGIIEKIKSRIPGYSDDLPPRRNIFGEPIVLSGGLGPDIMSPIYTSVDKKDPVAEEIVKQKTLVRMPMKSIKGVKLDTKQYDKYIQLYSGKNNRFVDKPLKNALRELFRTDMYKTATDGQEGGKSVLIRATFEGYREAAKAALIESLPGLQIDIRKSQTEKAIKLGATL